MFPVHRTVENRNPGRSSIYPLHPEGTRTLLRISDTDLTVLDRCVIVGSSLIVVGAFAWVPLLCTYLYRKWKSIPVHNKRRRTLYFTLFIGALLILTRGPHRSHHFGRWIQVRKWKLWSIWLKFIAMEVITDFPMTSNTNKTPDPVNGTLQQQQNINNNHQAILAFVPHGIFPFAFAFGALPEIGQQIFGSFRPVVATATNFLPVVNDFLLWINKIDASRSSVNEALSNGDRIGLVPGGIAEIFEGYPKYGTNPNDEYTIVRKGFIQLAQRYHIPIIPIYCFGATKMFRRWHIPMLDQLSSYIRASIVIFYGMWGLPIPYRQKLLYVIGKPIQPIQMSGISVSNDNTMSESMMVDTLYHQFCTELQRMFDTHKESYGWGHKSLHLLTR